MLGANAEEDEAGLFHFANLTYRIRRLPALASDRESIANELWLGLASLRNLPGQPLTGLPSVSGPPTNVQLRQVLIEDAITDREIKRGFL